MAQQDEIKSAHLKTIAQIQKMLMAVLYIKGQ